MKKILLFGCLGFIVVLIGTTVFIGFTVAKTVKGLAKPKSLGIIVSAADATSAQEKTTMKMVALPDSTPINQSIRFEGKKTVSVTMDSKELTALALSKTRYKYFPFHDVQIRINADNSVEISGLADTQKALAYASAIGFAPADVQNVMNEYNIPKTNVPFYVRGSGSVKNGNVTIDFSGGSIAGIPVPMGLVNDKKPEIIGLLEHGMATTPGFEAKSLTFSEGKMHFDGSVAEKELVVQ